MSLRRTLKQIMPPVLMEALIAIRNRRRWRPYASFDAALADCMPEGYEADELVDVVARKTEQFVASLSADGPTPLEISTLRTILGTALASRSDRLNVLDFGGAAGHHYYLARTILHSRLQLRWHVVETPAMASRAARTAPSGLEFFDDALKACERMAKIDLVFASGSLQYCREPLDMLRMLSRLGAESIFITRTGLSDGPRTLITVQHSDLASNGPGMLPAGVENRPVSYPVVLVERSEFENILRERYRIRFQILEDRAAYHCGAETIGMYGYFCDRITL